MGDEPPQFYNTNEEFCEVCEQQREHHVRIDVVTESENYGGNQPYRITECQVCGEKHRERVGMGDD